MRLVVFGAGAVGGVLGGLLHEAGHEVTLIARGAHLEAIRGGGLMLESADRRVALQVPAVSDAPSARVADADAVLLCVKSQDTAAALAALIEADRVTSRWSVCRTALPTRQSHSARCRRSTASA